jgi:magnesium transporter
MSGLRPPIELDQVLRTADLRTLARKLTRLDDVQIASQVDNLDRSSGERVFQALPVERRAAVFACLRYETAVSFVRRLAPEEAARLLDDLESDDVADILGELDKEKLGKILARLEPEEASEIEDLLAYDEDSAGGIMSPDFIAVDENATVSQAVRTIQELEEPPEQAFYVYVLDRDERLVGVLSLHLLVTSKPEQRVGDIMLREIVTVRPSTDQEHVADMVSRYDLLSVPVVDEKRHMLGVITIDDIVDVLREEATEDILKMAGAGEELGGTRSFWVSFRTRLPWLGAAAIGGLLVAVALSGFSTALVRVPTLALFMPVVAGMGGNVGIQSSTIVVRGLAVGYVETAKLSRVVAREMLLGVCLGLVYGSLIAVAAPLVAGAEVEDSLGLGLVLTGAMIGSMTIAATVGTCIPLVMDRWGIDPAVSTGPFVTTAVDALGLMFYFWLAASFFGIAL